MERDAREGSGRGGLGVFDAAHALLRLTMPPRASLRDSAARHVSLGDLPPTLAALPWGRWSARSAFTSLPACSNASRTLRAAERCAPRWLQSSPSVTRSARADLRRSPRVRRTKGQPHASDLSNDSRCLAQTSSALLANRAASSSTAEGRGSPTRYPLYGTDRQHHSVHVQPTVRLHWLRATLTLSFGPKFSVAQSTLSR